MSNNFVRAILALAILALLLSSEVGPGDWLFLLAGAGVGISGFILGLSLLWLNNRKPRGVLKESKKSEAKAAQLAVYNKWIFVVLATDTVLLILILLKVS